MGVSVLSGSELKPSSELERAEELGATVKIANATSASAELPARSVRVPESLTRLPRSRRDAQLTQPRLCLARFVRAGILSHHLVQVANAGLLVSQFHFCLRFLQLGSGYL